MRKKLGWEKVFEAGAGATKTPLPGAGMRRLLALEPVSKQARALSGGGSLLAMLFS
jgi:hypothetical protein